jgi:NAD(P)H-hydrate epimerase
MSTGGTGDILTGMIAAMIAQEIGQKKIAQGKVTENPNDALLAVLAAVHLHGLTGDVMRESVGEHSLVATDLLRGLPEAFWRAQSTAQEKFVRWDG